jgi:phage terminase large subunit-like protein
MAELLSDRALLAELLEEQSERKRRRKLYSYFPDKGPLRRELYKKHMAGFKAAGEHKHAWMMAGNRTGKTESWLLYMITVCATGRYPSWWDEVGGPRWNRPVKVWLAGKTGTTTRDILQNKLLGEANDKGTGLIPYEDILNTTAKSGIAEAVDTLYVKHVSGGTSVIQFKSFDQGRKAFEGKEQDIIGLDEEPPQDVYEECSVRTMTCDGKIWSSFTPLDGITELIANEFPEGIINEGMTAGGKYVVSMTWDDVPHLTQKMKDDLWGTIAPHLRDARRKGIPAVGAGLIYPVSPDDYVCDPFPIPDTWKKVYGLDVGWNKTAAMWGAIDPNTDTVYVYSEYYRGQEEPDIHAAAIKGRGPWIPGLIDPASRGRSQYDGRKLIDGYRKEGLDLYFAKNAREAGILKVWQALTQGKLKIFNSLHHVFVEMRLYRRDEDGLVIKENDHLMDALRYLVMTGREKARLAPAGVGERRKLPPEYVYGGNEGAWLAI